jgi:hypothetical protein
MLSLTALMVGLFVCGYSWFRYLTWQQVTAFRTPTFATNSKDPTTEHDALWKFGQPRVMWDSKVLTITKDRTLALFDYDTGRAQKIGDADELLLFLPKSSGRAAVVTRKTVPLGFDRSLQGFFVYGLAYSLAIIDRDGHTRSFTDFELEPRHGDIHPIAIGWDGEGDIVRILVSVDEYGLQYEIAIDGTLATKSARWRPEYNNWLPDKQERSPDTFVEPRYSMYSHHRWWTLVSDLRGEEGQCGWVNGDIWRNIDSKARCPQGEKVAWASGNLSGIAPARHEIKFNGVDTYRDSGLYVWAKDADSLRGFIDPRIDVLHNAGSTLISDMISYRSVRWQETATNTQYFVDSIQARTPSTQPVAIGYHGMDTAITEFTHEQAFVSRGDVLIHYDGSFITLNGGNRVDNHDVWHWLSGGNQGVSHPAPNFQTIPAYLFKIALGSLGPAILLALLLGARVNQVSSTLVPQATVVRQRFISRFLASHSVAMVLTVNALVASCCLYVVAPLL